MCALLRSAVTPPLRPGLSRTDNEGMQKRVAVADLLDKHPIRCPKCRCPEAVVVVNVAFEVSWQCVDCESKWPATDDETALLLGSVFNTIH